MSEALSTQRIEAFSDGVFSIAITLLVLELQLPTSSGAAVSHGLAAQLAGLWPAYIGFVMSFIMIGIYWANHHYIFRLYRGTDHAFNLLNLFFLMCISFLPFPASVLSQRVSRPEEAQTAVLFYAFGLLLPAIGFTSMWMYASHNHRLIDKRLAPAFVRKLTVQYGSSCVIYTGAMIVTHWSARTGLFICIVLTLLFLLPSSPPQYVSGATSSGHPTP